METENHNLEGAIGDRVRLLRTAKSLTLDELATRAGVSRAMISRIERGEASPTAQLLARLCPPLGVTLSTFFAFGETLESPLSRRTEQIVWRDPETGYLRRSVSPPGTPSRVEIIEVEFPAGARIPYPPETAKEGMTQHVWLFAGELEMTVGDIVHRLKPGDCLYMGITDNHVFHNPGSTIAHYAVVLDRGRG
ncbi:helix-turn-helix domain-containing protein [Sinorhizobium sp. BG8]|uniref:helix-turn-helix domain-containing protein n=1 Tax=Sinorhizobium sp. BG8 TaxID=2613773 RepID=UPI00193D96B2|nr:helix-turn-helix domain-containing protein [Sinorhizobium sp. BG8]QRM53900.1 helix-turn-helix transcriptional regulator [Sinorhizobium sp. BG8]